jgi:hypothetical protein
VNVILTHCSLENLDVLGITNLDNEFPAAFLNLSLEDMVPIFGDPN